MFLRLYVHATFNSGFIIITIIYFLTARVIGAPQMIIHNQLPPFFSVLHCPLGLGELQACPFPDVSSYLFRCLLCLLPPFTVACKVVLASPDERETCPYHCCLRLFTMVGSDCLLDLIRISSLVTRFCMKGVVICRSTSFQWLVFFFEALL